MLLKHLLNLGSYPLLLEKERRKKCFLALAYFHIGLHHQIGLPRKV